MALTQPSTSKIYTTKFQHRWILANFSNLLKENSLTFIFSEPFPPKNEEFQFSIRLQPKFIDEKDGNSYVSLYLYLEHCKHINLKTTYRLSILENVDDETGSNAKEKTEIFAVENCRGFSSFISEEDVQELLTLTEDSLTILCQVSIESKEHFKIETEKSSSLFHANENVITFSQKWIVNGFSTFYYDNIDNNQAYLKLKYACPSIDEDIKFYAVLMLTKDDGKECPRKYISFYLYLESDSVEEAKVTYRLSILDWKKRFYITAEGHDKFLSNGDGKGAKYFIWCDELMDLKKGLLPKDKLTVFAQIEISELRSFHNKKMLEETEQIRENSKNSKMNIEVDLNDEQVINPNCDGFKAHNNELTEPIPIRSAFPVTSGVCYYEVLPLTDGGMCFGWATREAKFKKDQNQSKIDEYAVFVEVGTECCIYHNGKNSISNNLSYKPGIVIGCLIDINKSQINFYINGEIIEWSEKIFFSRQPYYATAILSPQQECIFYFDEKNFKFSPKFLQSALNQDVININRYQLTETVEYNNYFWFKHPVIDDQVDLFYRDLKQAKCDKLVKQLEHDSEQNQTIQTNCSQIECGRLIQSVIEVMSRKLKSGKPDKMTTLIERLIIGIKNSNLKITKLLELLYPYNQLYITDANTIKRYNIFVITVNILLEKLNNPNLNKFVWKEFDIEKYQNKVKKSVKLQHIIWTIIDKNLLQIDFKNSRKDDNDLGYATFENVVFRCSKLTDEIQDIIVKNSYSNISKTEIREIIQNIDQQIKLNFDILIPVFFKWKHTIENIENKKYYVARTALNLIKIIENYKLENITIRQKIQSDQILIGLKLLKEISDRSLIESEKVKLIEPYKPIEFKLKELDLVHLEPFKFQNHDLSLIREEEILKLESPELPVHDFSNSELKNAALTDKNLNYETTTNQNKKENGNLIHSEYFEKVALDLEKSPDEKQKSAIQSTNNRNNDNFKAISTNENDTDDLLVLLETLKNILHDNHKFEFESSKKYEFTSAKLENVIFTCDTKTGILEKSNFSENNLFLPSTSQQHGQLIDQTNENDFQEYQTNVNKLVNLQTILSILIENNLLLVDIKENFIQNQSNLKLKNVVFTCGNFKKEIQDFIFNYTYMKLSKVDIEFVIEHINILIRENFANLLPILKNYSLLQQIINNELNETRNSRFDTFSNVVTTLPQTGEASHSFSYSRHINQQSDNSDDDLGNVEFDLKEF